jgi:hypothetical protein
MLVVDPVDALGAARFCEPVSATALVHGVTVVVQSPNPTPLFPALNAGAALCVIALRPPGLVGYVGSLKT